jgi:uncharacterized protein
VNLHRFTDPELFNQQVESYLIQREAENNLLLGLINSLRGGEFREYDPYLALIELNGAIRLVALRTPPFNLVISYTDMPEALALLVTDAHIICHELPGVLGPAEQSERFAILWRTATGQAYQHGMAQRIYQLECVQPVTGVDGSLRPITAGDRNLVEEWMLNFVADVGQEPDRIRARQAVERYLNAPPTLRRLFLWEVDGRPVSMAGYGGPTPNGYRVGAVYTPPELRRRGYASACVAAVSQAVLDMGRRYCFLYTDLSNPTSNHIYQEIGYRPVCNADEYQFV